MIAEYFNEARVALDNFDRIELLKMIDILEGLQGRLFIIGSGGGAGHASHAVCDFRKLCGIDALAPYDNVSFLSAVSNDKGYDHSIIDWLTISELNEKDCLFVLSVGGGQNGVSNNIIYALHLAKEMGAKIIGIVGKDGGKTKQLGDAVVVIPTKDYTTAVVEGIQSVIWHCIANHPKLLKHNNKWQ